MLRPDGLYLTDWGQPAIHFVAWDGSAFRVAKSYAERIHRREDGGIEFRHYMDDIFNGLLDVGFSIRRVEDLSRNQKPDSETDPGGWEHERTYVGGEFVVVAQKQRVSS